jgi:hypothetical protein
MLKTKYPYYRIDPETGDHIEITKSEYKAAMRREFTVRHIRLPICGHKFVPTDEYGPRHRNCQSCWFAFFQVHGVLTQEIEKAYQEHGPDIIRQTRGPKFLKMFLTFLGTIAQWKKASEEATVQKQETNEQSTSGTGSSDEPADIASGAD